MKDKTMVLSVLEQFNAPYAKLTYSLLNFFRFKKFHLSPLLNESNFAVRTIAFQARLSNPCLF